jgi:hypothetical protein
MILMDQDKAAVDDLVERMEEDLRLLEKETKQSPRNTMPAER